MDWLIFFVHSAFSDNLLRLSNAWKDIWLAIVVSVGSKTKKNLLWVWICFECFTQSENWISRSCVKTAPCRCKSCGSLLYQSPLATLKEFTKHSNLNRMIREDNYLPRRTSQMSLKMGKVIISQNGPVKCPLKMGKVNIYQKGQVKCPSKWAK